MKRWIKFGLVSLLSFVLSIGFGYCSEQNLGNIYIDIIQDSITVGSAGRNFYGGYCFREGSDFVKLDVYDNNGNFVAHGKSNGNAFFCVNFDGQLKRADGNTSDVRVYFYDLRGILSSQFFSGFYSSSCPECQTCPEVNTGDILSGSCDTNYCVENDLCPVPSNFSQLYINDIEHESAPLINVYVPDEIGWDYISDSGQFDLYVSGYNVDTEYIESLINTQNYKPSSDDFNNVITGLIPLFIPGLVIILFIRFIFRFIKKIF